MDNKKRYYPGLVIIALVIALCVCFGKLSKLEREITQLENAMNNQHQRLMNEVESIYSNVDTMLQEEASLLSDVTAEYGEINLEDHTIEVTVELVPKLISDDMRVLLTINGRSAELSRSGNQFSGTIPVDIYNMGEQMLMAIETESGIQTQYLSEIRVEYLWEGIIPSLYYCDISGSATFDGGKYTLDAAIDINCSPVADSPDVRFEKFMLVTELNGKEIDREDISEDVLNYQAYPHGVYFRDDYTMECEAVEGDELAIYLEATDSLGYVHRRLLHFWKEYNGALAEAVDASEYIYAPDGAQIFP